MHKVKSLSFKGHVLALILGKKNDTGASLAIDDRYEVWESGYISIPFDFQLQDLQPKLQRLLSASASSSTASSSQIAEDGMAAPTDRSATDRSAKIFVERPDSAAGQTVASIRASAQGKRGARYSQASPFRSRLPFHRKQSCNFLQNSHLSSNRAHRIQTFH